MADDKTFYFYFKRNMKESRLPCPETLFEKFGFAAGNIAAISAYVKANQGITLRTALNGVGHALKYSRGQALISGIINRIAVATLELGAAYYVGGCIGSFTVASLYSYSDFSNNARANNKNFDFNDTEFYSVADISRYAAKYKIAMSSEVQKELHKHSNLRKKQLGGL